MYYAITMNQMQGTGSTPLDALYVDYIQFFENLGCRLHGVSNYTEDIDSLLDHLPIEGIILSGGNDLGGEFTGGAARDIRNPSPARDTIEKKLLSTAMHRNLPVLGICRGLQFINMFFGGSVTEDIATELPGAGDHIGTEHMISIVDQTAQIWLGSRSFQVNSYHHQGVQPQQVAPELEIFALNETDRIVEGLFHPEKPIAGIQWHPERPENAPRENVALIRAFLEQRGYWRARQR